ncbi:sulfatase-like hydrolase/transferase, partial [Verrucomicrobiales bacterium]|nr:sulfatase-like hydrolase/transferase [Verrucomicrobiales bacterium]
MNLRTRLCAFVVVLGGVTLSAAEKPNILFLFADDQCFETIGALGLTDIETPNLDRLVERGTTFTRAYNMGSWSGAVCVASRHMLNTGAFVWHAQKISENIGKAKPQHADWPDFPKENLMWSQLMKSGGYDTYFTGKWHVRAKAEQIFDVSRNVRGGMPKQTPEGYNRPTQGVPDTWSPYDPKFGGFWEGGTHWSEVVADDAIDFLKMAKTETNPFFMYISFNAPHDPRQAPKFFIDKYPLDRIEVPANFLPEYPYKDQIDNRPGLRDEKLAPFPRTEYAVQVHRQEYFAIITHMDEQIGRILDHLEATGQDENTYIFFSADHG